VKGTFFKKCVLGFPPFENIYNLRKRMGLIFYKFFNHFFPDFVLVQSKSPTEITARHVIINNIESILLVLKINLDNSNYPWKTPAESRYRNKKNNISHEKLVIWFKTILRRFKTLFLLWIGNCMGKARKCVRAAKNSLICHHNVP
jgi:hypothetical protein